MIAKVLLLIAKVLPLIAKVLPLIAKGLLLIEKPYIMNFIINVILWLIKHKNKYSLKNFELEIKVFFCAS